MEFVKDKVEYTDAYSQALCADRLTKMPELLHREQSKSASLAS